MYRQILVEGSQRDLQCILWKVGPEEEIVTYRLKTVTYGMSNAPFLAIRTLQQLAQDEKTRFLLASEALMNDTYMDDIVSGVPDIETARRLQSELQDALQSCGMVLHKCYVLRFLNNLKQSVILSGSLSASELDLAEIKLIRMAQREIFSAEIRNLHDHKIILPNSKIKNLNPFLDRDGILRVGGRLGNSDLPYVAKYPAILPSNHILKNIIIMYFHKKNLHLGTSSLLHCVRQKYWPQH
ncbi:integrase catalytic domain-containing protein, partial [Trichonephila clavata]